MVRVVNLGGRLKIHQDGSAGKGLSRRKFYSNPRDAAPAKLYTGAEGKRRRMFLREEEEMSSAVYSRCYDNIWSARGQEDPRFCIFGSSRLRKVFFTGLGLSFFRKTPGGCRGPSRARR